MQAGGAAGHVTDAIEQARHGKRACSEPCSTSTRTTPALPPLAAATAAAAMEDTTMLDSSQPLFHDATFTIIPTGLIQDRVLEVH